MRITFTPRYAAALLLAASALLAAPAGAQDEAAALAGSYTVEGAEGADAAAQIMLFPDNRFRYRATSGGKDAYAEGRWLLRSRALVLQADQLRAQFSDVAEHRLPHDEYESAVGQPVLMAVTVKTPKYGLVWSGVQVSYKLSDGTVVRGETGPSGDHGIGELGEGVTVAQIGLALPSLGLAQHWFPVEEPETRWFMVTLDPGRYIQAFKSVSLRIGAGGQKALQAVGSREIVNGRYKRVAPLYLHSKARSALASPGLAAARQVCQVARTAVVHAC